ncbi:plasma membrane proteolipid 3 [Penicillium soppii]|uniref:plasma membrane proteolipid 3 n=1 Tax=Penicillium soppii TaxID=69789 RepID=UPI0025498059|nr:plasma membrane proteolipid 3 [Penicillium soppii]KAJ5863604.1 plasma membrane proteolipid 3 [Penicillium soppii]
MPFTASDICKIIIAIILPPLGVFLERGCGADLLINICLTILGYLPGIIHAIKEAVRIDIQTGVSMVPWRSGSD